MARLQPERGPLLWVHRWLVSDACPDGYEDDIAAPVFALHIEPDSAAPPDQWRVGLLIDYDDQLCMIDATDCRACAGDGCTPECIMKRDG